MSDLPKSMRALVLTGPGKTLEVQEMPLPKPGPGQVLVQVAASPINPSDLAMLRGEYGLRWPYPLVPGLEGSGQVVADGGGMLARFMRGKRVSLAAEGQGLWAEYAAVSAKRVVPLLAGTPLGIAACSFVNPLTAIALVGEVRRAGQWAAVSTASGGALGGMIRRRAKEKGVKLINIVRKAEQVETLRAEGARYVLDETAADFDADLAALCKELRCRMAFDAVGGQMTYRLAEALRSESDILVYGGLAGKAAALNPGTLIFKQARVRGFWLSKWLSRKTAPEMIWLTRQVAQGLQGGFAETRIAQVVPLDEASAAPAAYEQAMSAGKTLIAPGSFDLGVAT
ncbi:zinc-binding dehydrogenase [Gymnodinialimonas sp. 2305UL16-5]|uniref:alcohol dehydrogenase catalytic domain-containing protein n=1 Tax=Gymnodinialimonas mytili TaxID=3126503 RepID=UPI0030B05C93